MRRLGWWQCSSRRLATKYDLMLFNPHTRRIFVPFEEMAELASATFWPRGAIRAFVAGGIGAALFAIGWVLGIPVVSWIAELVGGFLVVLTVVTVAHEGRKLLGRRRRE